MTRRPWSKVTNDDLAMNLEMWMMMDGRLTTDWQREFFEEVIWRLLMSDFPTKEEVIENGE